MIDRYLTNRMKEIWDDKNKFQKYLDVELAVISAWVNEGIIPKEDYNLIKKNAKLNLKKIREIESETKHDVIAFIKSISEQLGSEQKWFHYGLTSTDVVDTAYSLQLKKANEYILENIEGFLNILKSKAIEHKFTPIMGRTHGVHAEITSLGLKFLLWYDEMKRNLIRFKLVTKEIEVGKISGAVGNFVNAPPNIQDYVCKKLKIGSSKISTQTLQRDRHAHYISVIAIIGTTLEKISIEIRNSQRTEVNELMEYFSLNQKGSSAMPHKKNPISSENLCGISRVLRGYAITAMENNQLWYERDISHSSVERIIIPDSTSLLDYSLDKISNIVRKLIINKEQMLRNINLTHGIIFSQRVLNSLIKKGINRIDAYDIIQKLTKRSWDEKVKFIDLLKNDEIIISKLTIKEIENLFDINFYFKEIDKIFERVLS